MGTRADFYILEDDKDEMKWLGSIAYDGYPSHSGNPSVLRGIEDPDKYKREVRKIIKELDHGTSPKQGWPWDWNDSLQTDYAYLFADNSVYIHSSGDEKWIDMTAYLIREDLPTFPNMKKKKKVARGIRSGFLTLQVKHDAEEEDFLSWPDILLDSNWR